MLFRYKAGYKVIAQLRKLTPKAYVVGFQSGKGASIFFVSLLCLQILGLEGGQLLRIVVLEVLGQVPEDQIVVEPLRLAQRSEAPPGEKLKIYKKSTDKPGRRKGG
jgi:hypothetical protein